MKIASVFIVFALLLTAGCDGYRDFAGPAETPEDPPPGAPALGAGTYDVAYLVEGTYDGCTITYQAQDRTLLTTDQPVRLPWTRTFQISLNSGSSPFEAQVSATCADETRLGKSTAAIVVNQEVRDRASAVGFGATARARHTLWPR